MTAIDIAIEELKNLPFPQQKEAVQFIHELGNATKIQKNNILDELAGSISAQEAQEWEEAVNECRKIEHENW